MHGTLRAWGYSKRDYRIKLQQALKFQHMQDIRERTGSDCLPLFPVTLAVALLTFLNMSAWPPSLYLGVIPTQLH